MTTIQMLGADPIDSYVMGSAAPIKSAKMSTRQHRYHKQSMGEYKMNFKLVSQADLQQSLNSLIMFTTDKSVSMPA